MFLRYQKMTAVAIRTWIKELYSPGERLWKERNINRTIESARKTARTSGQNSPPATWQKENLPAIWHIFLRVNCFIVVLFIVPLLSTPLFYFFLHNVFLCMNSSSLWNEMYINKYMYRLIGIFTFKGTFLFSPNHLKTHIVQWKYIYLLIWITKSIEMIMYDKIITSIYHRTSKYTNKFSPLGLLRFSLFTPR